MTEQQIIDELANIVSYCDVTKEAAKGLMKKLNKPARKKGGLSSMEIAKVLAGREKHRNKKAIATNNG